MIYQVQDDNQNILDANLNLDSTGIDFLARGGNKKSGINIDYGHGLRLILERLKRSKIKISGIWVNSSRVQNLTITERLVLSGKEFEQESYHDAFTIISRRMVTIGQSKKSQSGGNSTKKIRIQFEQKVPVRTSRTALILNTAKTTRKTGFTSTKSRTVEINERNKKPYKGRQTRKEIIIEQNEDKLVNRYKKFLLTKKLGKLKKNFIEIVGEEGIHETDGWIEETKTLIEAKSETSRPNIRMAIGQLHDYKRHLRPKPKSLTILLPTCPNSDLIELIFSQKIDIVYEEDRGFVTIKRKR